MLGYSTAVARAAMPSPRPVKPSASVVVAGNIGTALTTLPGAIDRSAVVVCEASSFQLEDTEEFAPDAAVLLNLAEDHLDRYRTVDAYRAAKLQAFARQPAGALAVAPPALVGELGGAAERVTFGPGLQRRAAEALRGSLLEFVDHTSEPPALEGYQQWRDAGGGVFTLPLADAVQSVEDVLTATQDPD